MLIEDEDITNIISNMGVVHFSVCLKIICVHYSSIHCILTERRSITEEQEKQPPLNPLRE